MSAEPSRMKLRSSYGIRHGMELARASKSSGERMLVTPMMA